MLHVHYNQKKAGKKSEFDREVASVRQWIPMIPSARFNISNILHLLYIYNYTYISIYVHSGVDEEEQQIPY